MTILVTGGAGYIGSHMAWELLDHGEDVVVVDSLVSGFDWAVPPGAKLVVGDVGDSKLIEGLLKEGNIEAILHFAGSVSVPESIADPLSYYANNTLNTHNLMTNAVKFGVEKILFSSTAAVYGAVSSRPIREDEALNPGSPYGRSKLASEWMLTDAANAHGLKYAALRYFNVAGGDPEGRAGHSTPGTSHLIKVACETALGARPSMQVFGDDYDTPDGTCIRDFIHVTDLVCAHMLALDYLRSGGENIVANCGYGHGHSVREVIDCVKKVSGREFEVLMSPRREGDLAAVIANADRGRQAFGWNPQYDDLEVIVSTALKWEQSLIERSTDILQSGKKS